MKKVIVAIAILMWSSGAYAAPRPDITQIVEKTNTLTSKQLVALIKIRLLRNTAWIKKNISPINGKYVLAVSKATT